MPNNLSDCAMFKIRNGAELKDTLERAEKKAQCFAGRILKGKKFRRGFNPLSHSVGYVCQRKWWQKGENEKKSSLQIDAQKCVGCGLCAGRCPVHNIRIENGARGLCEFFSGRLLVFRQNLTRQFRRAHSSIIRRGMHTREPIQPRQPSTLRSIRPLR